MGSLGRFINVTENFLFSKNRLIFRMNSWNEFAHMSKKVELPVPPKRPLTAYMLFCKENRKDLIKENPSLTIIDQIKVLAEKWNHLPLEAKKPFEVMAREGNLVYGEEHKKFYESLTEDQKELIAKQKADKRESRRLSKLKKALQESGIPKAPLSAYTLFIQSRAKVKGDKKLLGDFIKEVAEKWKSLPEETKKTFEEQAQAEKTRYLSEMEAWRERLVQEGNENLLKEYETLKPKGKHLIEDTSISKVKPKKETKEKPVKQTKPDS